MSISIQEYINWVKNWTIDPKNIINWYIDKNKNQNFPFVRLHTDYVNNEMDDLISKDLCWATIWIQDNILTKWHISCSGSKMMESFVAPYSATAFENLEKHWWLMIGKIKINEFGLINDAKNNIEMTAGTAAGFAVAEDYCMACLATDSWWELRISAALNGVVGVKPTYGRVSRYWVQANTSSMDQLWVIAKNVEDAEILIKAIASFDSRDSQSQKKADKRENPKYKISRDKIKIAIIQQSLEESDPKIQDALNKTISQLKNQWAEISEIKIDNLTELWASRQILSAAELSSNLSRLDGIRFGLQDDTHKYSSIDDYYQEIRAKGFGDEIQKQILFGTFLLTADNYDKYYLKAKALRNKLKKDFEKIFEDFDLIISPTITNIEVNSENNLNLQKYIVLANLTGNPALSINLKANKSTSIQLIWNKREETKLFEIWKIIEKIDS